MIAFRNVNTGQVVTVEGEPSHLSGLARWERIEEELSAPVNPDAPFVVFTDPDLTAVGLPDPADAARAAQAELDKAAAELAPNAQAFIESAPAQLAPERPADDADRKDWLAYAKARGKTDADLKGVKLVDIRAMFAD